MLGDGNLALVRGYDHGEETNAESGNDAADSEHFQVESCCLEKAANAE